MFATLLRAAERWRRITITRLEHQQLDALCRALGLAPAGETKNATIAVA